MKLDTRNGNGDFSGIRYQVSGIRYQVSGMFVDFALISKYGHQFDRLFDKDLFRLKHLGLLELREVQTLFWVEEIKELNQIADLCAAQIYKLINVKRKLRFFRYQS